MENVKNKNKNKQEIHCGDCKHLTFSDFYGECGKAHKGIVTYKDSCEYAEAKETKKTVDKLRDYIKAARNLAPEITDDCLLNNGAIFYMNGNDGTYFDFLENERTCEFFVFHNNDRGFIKAWVTASDKLIGYVYKDGALAPTHTLPVMQLSEGEGLRLAAQMYELTDSKELYDVDIDTLNFSQPVSFNVIKMLSPNADDCVNQSQHRRNFER